MSSKIETRQREAERPQGLAAVARAGEPTATCEALQRALGEIGEELDRYEKSATSGLRHLQQRLEGLSQQIASAEQQLAERFAAAVQSDDVAGREEPAAGEQAVGPAQAATPHAGEDEVPQPTDKPPGGETGGSTAQKVVEPKITQSPPDHATLTPNQVASDAPPSDTAPSDAAASASSAAANGSPAATQPMPTARAAPAASAPAAQPVAARPVAQAVAAPTSSPGGGHRAWERIVLGETLACQPAFARERAALIDGLLAGDETAAALVGQLLIFNAASPERMPQLLRDVGEAYYAWRPHVGADAFRDALVDAIHARCEAQGVSNTIELVQPGDRFDHTKHNSKQRGVEIGDVLGWVVLRDNGKVYTKASVTVK